MKAFIEKLTTSIPKFAEAMEVSKDQLYGGLILIFSIIIAVVYLTAFFGPKLGLLAPYWYEWAVGLPVLLAVLAILVIAGWIGYTMLTTPPPAPLELEGVTTPAGTPEEAKEEKTS